MHIDIRSLSPSPTGPATPGEEEGGRDPNAMLAVRIVTHNIRYATSRPSWGEEPWSTRCPRLCAQLSFTTSTSTGSSSPPSCSGGSFICLQEVLHSQLQDVQSHLGPLWSSIGVGRDDGRHAGEFSPIFYQHSRWRCVRSKTYWLSPTPEVPSRGWDAVLPRIVTMGSFLHIRTGASVVIMSTHFDHVGELARRESAKLLMKLAKTWVDGDGNNDEHEESSSRVNSQTSSLPPVFIGGDFNSTPSDGAYKTITSPTSGWTDVQSLFTPSRRYGNVFTFTGFSPDDKDAKTRIDFIFSRQHPRVRHVSYGVLANRFDDGVFLSDHRAVVADIEIPATSRTARIGG